MITLPFGLKSKKIEVYDLIRVGDVITVDKGLELARFFKMQYIVERLEKHPEKFNSFVFDGCSLIPDRLLYICRGLKWKDVVYKACLLHDIQFGYGQIGNTKEEAMANAAFFNNLIDAGMLPWLAHKFLAAVETGGAEEFGASFSWGFANKG